jgi:DNA-binding HxlR family transcriptional regulator
MAAFLSEDLGGNMRLSELKALMPDISEKMLIQELKTMVASGLVNRKNHGEVPPKVEYSLTEIGNDTKHLVAEMANFAARYEQFISS